MVELRRENRARDPAGFFVAGENRGAARGRLSSVEHQAGELAVHVAPRVNALDDFLAEVAAFVEADRVIDAGLEQYIVLAHVDAVARQSGLDAENFLRLQADPAPAESRAGALQCFSYRHGVLDLRDDVEAFLARVRRAYDPRLAAV